jgi:RimJ/RimL family protein N-acetyltransferase
MEISKCQLGDSNQILSLYEAARNLQIERKTVVWPFFEKSFIENEIQQGRQWKIELEGTIACNWSIAFEDKDIWGNKDKGDSIYIHRICNNPTFRGKRYIDTLVAWAVLYAKDLGKSYVRLDTLGYNTKLISHYTSAGFEFLGMHELTNTANLPGHYQTEPNCCFFELDIRKLA